jgi:guanylate kinase
MKRLGNRSQGLLFVLSAPAGTGKTTLAKRLLEEFPEIVESVSCTTRLPRPGEVEGRDYHFLSHHQFEEKIKGGDFLEYARVFDHLYGTSKQFVVDQQKRGKHVLLVIDTQGAMQLQKLKVQASYIFVRPPSFEELRDRLAKRRTESAESMEGRLSRAQHEIGMATHYDYDIVNDNLEVAYDVLRSIIIAEEHRRK